MDVNRLRTGQIVAAVSGLLLFIFEFFKWYGIHLSSEEQKGLQLAKNLGVHVPSTSVNAWKAFDWVDIIMFLTFLIAVAAAVVAAMESAPAIPVSMSVLTTGAGGLATLLILYRIINQPGPNDLVDVKIGAWLGLVAAIGVTVGGYMSMQEEPATARPAGGAAPPPPPPAAPPPAAPPPSEPPAAG